MAHGCRNERAAAWNATRALDPAAASPPPIKQSIGRGPRQRFPPRPLAAPALPFPPRLFFPLPLPGPLPFLPARLPPASLPAPPMYPRRAKYLARWAVVGTAWTESR